MDAFDVVDDVAASGVRHRLAVIELVATINHAVRRDHFQIEIIDERRNCRRKTRHVRIGQRDLQRFIRTRHHHPMLVHLTGRQQIGLIDELMPARRTNELGQIDAAPAFVHVRNRSGAEAVVHIDGRIDQRRFHEGRGGRRAALDGPIILHEYRRRTGDMGSSLAGAPLVLVKIVDRRPGVLVGGRFRLQGGDPCARRHDVRFDAPIFTRTTTRKIRHRIRAVRIDEKIEPIVLGRSGGDDVLGDGRAVDGLGARTGVAGGELQNVGLIARSRRVGVPHQGVEFRRTQVVPPLRVIAPTVGSDHRPGAHRVPGQRFRGRQFVIPHAVEDALNDEMRTGGNTQSIQVTAFVGFARGRVSGDNAGDMGPMTVFVRGIGERSIKKEGIDTAGEVGVHRGRVTIVQSRIGHSHGDSRTIETKLLRRRARSVGPVVAAHDLRSDFIDQPHPWRRFDPQHRFGLRERGQLRGGRFALKNRSESRFALTARFGERPLDDHPVPGRRLRRQENTDGRNLPAPCVGMDFVFGPIGSDPTYNAICFTDDGRTLSHREIKASSGTYRSNSTPAARS